MCARAELSLVVAWSARGQPVCVSVEEFTGSPFPSCACYTPWGITVRLGLAWNGSGLTYISKPVFFKTLVYFQRAHPPFVFYFTATFISFSCCLIRARSPV